MKKLLNCGLILAVFSSATLALAIEARKPAPKRSQRLKVTKVSLGDAVEGPTLAAPYDAPVAIQPTPDAAASGAAPQSMEPGAQPIPAAQSAIPLYHCVKYRDERNIAPCAIPQIVMVKDPCPPPCDPCNACATPPVQCVAVEICVPACSTCPPKVTCKRDGAYVKYDFGKYRVEIRSRKGVVTVDYDA